MKNRFFLLCAALLLCWPALAQTTPDQISDCLPPPPATTLSALVANAITFLPCVFDKAGKADSENAAQIYNLTARLDLIFSQLNAITTQMGYLGGRVSNLEATVPVSAGALASPIVVNCAATNCTAAYTTLAPVTEIWSYYPYGNTAAIVRSPASSTLSFAHSLTFTGLTPATRYVITLQGKDAAGATLSLPSQIQTTAAQ